MVFNNIKALENQGLISYWSHSRAYLELLLKTRLINIKSTNILSRYIEIGNNFTYIFISQKYLFDFSFAVSFLY